MRSGMTDENGRAGESANSRLGPLNRSPIYCFWAHSPHYESGGSLGDAKKHLEFEQTFPARGQMFIELINFLCDQVTQEELFELLEGRATMSLRVDLAPNVGPCQFAHLITGLQLFLLFHKSPSPGKSLHGWVICNLFSVPSKGHVDLDKANSSAIEGVNSHHRC